MFFFKKACLVLMIDCFEKCTNWSSSVKTILFDIIMYTVENQQIFWNTLFFTWNLMKYHWLGGTLFYRFSLRRSFGQT